MDDQRFHICYVSEQREQLQVIDEVFCFLCISLDLEGEDRTASVREIFLIKSLLLRVLGYRRMMNRLYLRMIIQILYHLQCVLHMTLYTKRQSLKSLQENPGMNRRNGSSGITQKDCTDLGHKCSRSYCFGKADAMIARVRLCQ